MEQVERIDATEAREKTLAGEALLVCAYDDESKCRRLLLDEAMTLGELEAARDRVSRDDEIIFYCA